MDKAEQPTTQADRRLDELKPRDIDGHLSDAIQDCLRQRFGLVLSTSETTIMAQGAIAALNTRTASPAAQDGLVEALRLFVGCAYPVAEEINQRGHNWCEAYLDDALPIARAALASLGEQHD